MAAAARQDDQGNVVQVGEEGADGEEGEYQCYIFNLACNVLSST